MEHFTVYLGKKNTVENILFETTPFIVESLEDLKFINHCLVTNALLDKGIRKTEKFLMSAVLMADIDSGASLEEIKKDLKDYCYYICSSKSYNKPKHGIIAERFHVFFPLSKTYTDKTEYVKMAKAALAAFLYFDPAVIGAVRQLAPGSDYVYEYNPGKYIDNAPTTLEYLEQQKKLKANDDKNKIEMTEQKTEAKKPYLMDEVTLKSRLTMAAKAGMFDDYSRWIKLGAALKTAGYNIEYWQNLSWNDIEISVLQNKWDSFNETTGATKGTLYYYAANALQYAVKNNKLAPEEAAVICITKKDTTELDIYTKYLEKRYLVTEQTGSQFVVNTSNGQLYTISQFTELMANKQIKDCSTKKVAASPLAGFKPFSKYFLSNVKVYSDNEVGYFPYNPYSNSVTNKINFFSPFLKGDKDCLDHPATQSFLKEVVFGALCDNDEKKYNYLIHWLSKIIVHPENKALTPTSFIFQGHQGTGKTFFGEVLQELFNTNNIHITSDLGTLENFNGALRNKILLIGEETAWSGNHKQLNIIKHLITGNTITINEKYKPSILVPSYLRMIQFTNSEEVTASATERRFLVYRVNDSMKGSPKFGWYRDNIKTIAKGISYLAYQTYDENYSLIENYFKTEEVKERIVNSHEDSFDRFIIDKVLGEPENVFNLPMVEAEDCSLDKFTTSSYTYGVVIKDLFDKYNTYLADMGRRVSTPVSVEGFSKKFRKLFASLIDKEERKTISVEKRAVIHFKKNATLDDMAEIMARELGVDKDNLIV